MYVFRGFGEADPWANAAPDQTQDTGLVDAVIGTLKSLPLVNTFAPQVNPAVPSAGAQASSTTAIVPKKPWFKTPLGIGVIVLGAFLGYRYYKKRKA
jgi:hypothetical protein